MLPINYPGMLCGVDTNLRVFGAPRFHLSKSCWLSRSRKVSVDMMHICGFRKFGLSENRDRHAKMNPTKSAGLMRMKVQVCGV